jgi:hypothetical protein
MAFQTQEALEPVEGSESISRKYLVNTLNYLNFNGNRVVVNLKSRVDGNEISLRALPEPCSGDTVALVWSETPPKDIAVAYELINILVDRGSGVIAVQGQLISINRTGASVLLPLRCDSISRRRLERFGSTQVRAIVSCSDKKAAGDLQDFGGGCLKIRLTVGDAGSLMGAGDKASVGVILFKESTAVYVGAGHVARRTKNGEMVDFVVSLTVSEEEMSLDGQQSKIGRDLVGVCHHPLCDRIVLLRLTMSSHNSFVVNEHPDHVSLFPGLIIPEFKLDFGAGDYARCTARINSGADGTWSFSIIDMPIPDQRKLFCFVENEAGMSSGVCAAIDPKAIVRFFFESGFIYPAKYVSLERARERLKEMLSHLYVDTPVIAQHFVQHEKGIVEAHIAMVRFYDRAWVVHHHTAVGGTGAGSRVLAQIFRYIHSYGAFPSTGMDYVMTYYRPENRFPDKVLGGLSRSLKTPSLSSIDPFAYLHLFFKEREENNDIDTLWTLEPASREDLLELEAFYQRTSGGLTLKAFGLEAAAQGHQTVDLDAEFANAGLHRRKSVISLKYKGRLKAVAMSLDSDDGLNMSNLMKSIHVFVIDESNLHFEELVSQLNGLSHLYEEPEIPMLVFPHSYMSNQGMNLEKVYNLLIFDISVGKRFAEFVERVTNRAVRRSYEKTGVSTEESE